MALASALASEQQLLSAQPERRTELRVSDRSILWAFEYVDLAKGIANHVVKREEAGIKEPRPACPGGPTS